MIGVVLGLAAGIVWFIARAAKRFDLAYAEPGDVPGPAARVTETAGGSETAT